MGWHLSGVTRTRIRVIAIYFSDFLIKERKCSLSQRGIRVSEFEVTE